MCGSDSSCSCYIETCRLVCRSVCQRADAVGACNVCTKFSARIDANENSMCSTLHTICRLDSRFGETCSSMVETGLKRTIPIRIARICVFGVPLGCGWQMIQGTLRLRIVDSACAVHLLHLYVRNCKARGCVNLRVHLQGTALHAIECDWIFRNSLSISV